MLRDIQIQNYRCFEAFSVDGFGQVNLIVGENNSGKTSLLEAIYLLVNQPTSEKVKPSLIEILERRQEYIEDTYKESAFEPEERLIPRINYLFDNIYYGFKVDWEKLSNKNTAVIVISSQQEISTELKIFFGFSDSFPVDPVLHFISKTRTNEAKIKTSNNVFIDFPIKVIKYIHHKVIKYNHNIYREIGDYERNFRCQYEKQANNRINRNSESSYDFLYPCNTKYIPNDGISLKTILNLWDEISLTDKEDKVIEALQIINPDVEKVGFFLHENPKRPKVKIKGYNNPIPLNSMGSGMNKILGLAAFTVSVENGILLVDEIETGLHYKAQTNMWRLLIQTAKQLNVQIFATTHSWDCISAYQEALELTFRTSKK
ncbi:MAG: ATP/GTP-binding protein [Microcystaceae cyanobacterium]